MTEILVLYYSEGGSTAAMARSVARGVARIEGATALVRTVPAVTDQMHGTADPDPESGPPYASLVELKSCDGLILGSPIRFGNMAASLKYFLEQTSAEWFSGALIDKPAGLFVSGGSMHGGQESTLLSMMLPLFHHGMVMVGLPYSLRELSTTSAGGTPYGASHVAGGQNDQPVTESEASLCQALGERVARLSGRLKGEP